MNCYFLTSHNVGSSVEVDHDGPLLGVELGAVDVEVKAVFVTCERVMT